MKKLQALLYANDPSYKPPAEIVAAQVVGEKPGASKVAKATRIATYRNIVQVMEGKMELADAVAALPARRQRRRVLTERLVHTLAEHVVGGRLLRRRRGLLLLAYIGSSSCTLFAPLSLS